MKVPPPPWIFTSSICDPAPAFHSTGVTRGLTRPVNMPRPVSMLSPPLGASIIGSGPPRPA
jgi:hypothetical protein